MDSTALVNNRVKIRENKKYLNFNRELREVWNMKMIVIPIVVGAPGTAQPSSPTPTKAWKRNWGNL